MDFAAARHLMVETQVRTADVTDPALLGAMRALPREAFVPAPLKRLAYSDVDLEVGPGRRLLRPRDLSKLLQALAPRPGDTALEILGATGYGAGLLAMLCAKSVLLEPDPSLNFAAVAAFGACGLERAQSAATDVTGGWPDQAPYDLIVLNGAAEVVPDAWIAQLAEGGRLGVIVRSGPAGQARIYTKVGGVVSYRVVFDAAPAVAPGLAAAPGFAF